MKETFNVVAQVIKERRSIKPEKMNGNIIPDEQVQALLQLADWAPTHGLTEPWRFVVYGPGKAEAFRQQHAELYRQQAAEADFSQMRYDKLLTNGEQASHIIIAIMRRGDRPNIPVIEELAATACAIDNILLGAQALGLAGFWSTGGMVHHDIMKQHLGLRDEDRVMGLLFLGYTDTIKEGKRLVALEDKVTWA